MYIRNSKAASSGASVVFGTFAVVLFVLLADFAEAKRGCSAFGHACFGGHGKKRSDGDVFAAGDDGILMDNVPDMTSQQLLYPPVALTSEINDDVNALRGYPTYQKLVPAQLSPLVRKWLQSYRRAQEAQQDNQL